MATTEDLPDLIEAKKPYEEPVVGGHQTFTTVSDKITGVVLHEGTGRVWIGGFVIAFFGLNVLGMSIAYLFYMGIGIWGVNIPVGWGFAIINFVWWIGIGHAGTLISAILLLLHQKWRTSINRFSESMTLFAVACAGIFPLIHTGRPWYAAYWLLPIPNTMQLWPQFRSPLIWDVFAISTYLTVSLLFWYVGLIPDFGNMRDRALNIHLKRLFGMLSFGWRGSARHWQRYEKMYIILAGLSTPLVVSVHTIVSFDFAVSVVPGWHATIFPPYFVAGAIFSGFAMVLSLCIPARYFYGLQNFITDKHLDNMAKIMLATGMMVFFGYMVEAFMGWYASGDEWLMIRNRAFGPYGFFYWMLILCNGIIPQLLWSPAVRRNPAILFIISLVVNVGMWLERFIIVITLHQGTPRMTSTYGLYCPTIWDWLTYFGTIGMFLFFMFLFCRLIPMIAIAEMHLLLPASHPKHAHPPSANGEVRH